MRLLLSAPLALSLALLRAGPAFSGERAAAARPTAVRKLILLGHKEHRDFLLERPSAWARRNGVELYLADDPARREASRAWIPDSRFIGADIDSHDPAVLEASAVNIARDAEKAGFSKADRIYTLLNPYVELTGKLVDRLGVLGNSFATASSGHTKAKAREIWAQDPELFLDYQVLNQEAPRNARERAAVERDVGRAFRRIASSGSSGSVVLKPVHGAGSALVEAGIDSERKAIAAWKKIDAGLRDPNLPGKKFFMLDHYPGIMMEYEAMGIETDLDGVRAGPGRDPLQIMADNAPMDGSLRVEKNYALPSQLPARIQERGKRQASKALDALGFKRGNSHIEQIYSPADDRWNLVEANLRIGGIMIEPLVRAWIRISLIDEGLNSLFDLPINLGRRPDSTIETRLVSTTVSGRIVKSEGLKEAARMPGVFRVDELKKVGQEIKAAPEHASDYFAAVSAQAPGYWETMALTLAALRRIRYTVLTPDGRLVEQRGDYSHVPVDINALLASGRRP